MLFKIILFLSHGCFAKTKRNLKWKGGWVGERRGCGRLCSCLRVNCPFAAEEWTSQQERHKHFQFIDYHRKVLLNLSKKISLFLPILKAFHYYHRKLCTSITIPLLHSTWQSQRPWMYDSSQGWVSRGLQYGHSSSSHFSPVLCNPSPSHSIIKKGNWLIFGFGTSHA